MSDQRQDWAALRALADAATPGSWMTLGERANGSAYVDPVERDGPMWIALCELAADAAFIAAARQAVPDLLAEVDRLTEALEAAHAALHQERANHRSTRRHMSMNAERANRAEADLADEKRRHAGLRAGLTRDPGESQGLADLYANPEDH